MELKATSPAQYSGLPGGQIVPDDDHGDAAGQADHDQAHHVFRVAGRKRMARKNIRMGPMTQFWTSERTNTL